MKKLIAKIGIGVGRGLLGAGKGVVAPFPLSSLPEKIKEIRVAKFETQKTIKFVAYVISGVTLWIAILGVLLGKLTVDDFIRILTALASAFFG